jgi:osmoprotectant transport system substrate-binding protein
MKKLMLLVITLFLTLTMVACSNGSVDQVEGEPVIIAGKKWTEQYILPHILAQYIQAHSDIPVEINEGLGEVSILTPAIQKGDIDMYVEYTGTGLEAVLKEKASSDESAEDIYNRVKKGYKENYNLVWLKPLGFENGYALAYPKEKNKEINAQTFSDLVPQSNQFVFGGPHQFYERVDGFDALVEAYGFNFKDTKSLDPNIMYAAVNDGDVDVIPAFTTDGRIVRFDLHTLKDDKAFFPPYYAAPIVRQETLNMYPELEELVNELAGSINEAEMSEMNAKVDLDGEEPSDVARQFLLDKGLINE